MEVSVFDHTGKDTGKKVTLSESIFGVAPNEHAIYLDVKQYLANQRQGTHKAKERAEVSYSTKKLKKQKGTGGARAGSRKSPLFRGGGRIFGPRPRDYSFKLNKKVKTLARKSALSTKASSSAISVLADFTFNAPKTKDYVSFLNAFSLAEKKTLLILPENNLRY
jgi:large subunit ribosomal protein L4